MNFNFECLARQFDSTTLARGTAYSRKGNVISVRRDGPRIDGRVAGSGANVYRQTIHLEAGRQGIEFEGTCSCPMTYNCKHVVAVLLTSLEQTEDAPEEPGTALPATAEFWLQQLAQAHSVLRSAAAPAVR